METVCGTVYVVPPGGVVIETVGGVVPAGVVIETTLLGDESVKPLLAFTRYEYEVCGVALESIYDFELAGAVPMTTQGPDVEGARSTLNAVSLELSRHLSMICVAETIDATSLAGGSRVAALAAVV